MTTTKTSTATSATTTSAGERAAKPVVWVERKADPATVGEIAAKAEVHPVLARVMAGRGVDADGVGGFLAPKLKMLGDPARLFGTEAAVERLAHAVEHHERVGIFGDYDVDGVTSTTVLWDVLEGLDGDVIATLPDRLVEGYGLSRAGVDRLSDGGAKLIVTVDCGVTAHEEVAYANKKGMDVIVVDHHTVPVQLPAAVSVINPHRKECTAGAEDLCAVGVVFNLCAELRRHLRAKGYFRGTRREPDLRDVLDLVALGTVADVVPLRGDNRVFVSFGVKVIDAGRRVGMRALVDVARLRGPKVSSGHLGFQLGPRINAAGRLGDAMKAVRLFRTQNPAEAADLARRLDEENVSRRDIERRIVEEATRRVTESEALRSGKAIVVGDEGWHPGVVGIVASRLVDRFGRPTVVVGEGGRGSGRSIPAFHLHDALVACADTLEGFGGHQHAAGVRVPPGGLDRFRDALMGYAEGVLDDDALGRHQLYDGEVDVADIDLPLCIKLERAAPFGRKNPEPVFRINNIAAKGIRELSGGHFKCVISERPYIEAIVFGQGERMDEFAGPLDLLAVIERNHWRGAQSIQLRVRDFASSGVRP